MRFKGTPVKNNDDVITHYILSPQDIAEHYPGNWEHDMNLFAKIVLRLDYAQAGEINFLDSPAELDFTKGSVASDALLAFNPSRQYVDAIERHYDVIDNFLARSESFDE